MFRLINRAPALAVALGTSILLAGCMGAPPAATTGTTKASPSTIAPATPTLSFDGTPTPSAPATPSVSPSGKPTASLPATSGAYPVTGLAAFASPSGRIWCATDGKAAWCHFPKGMTAKVPPSSSVCPGEDLDVTGVTVDGAEPGYFCSGDPTAFPRKGSDEVKWHDTLKLPYVSYDGFSLAVLPYGKSIIQGNYICAVAEVGVTCGSIVTKHGFRMSVAGPEFF